MHEPALILGGISYGRVGFTGTALLVRVTNTRTVKCVDCHSNIETGQGIRYKEYRHNGFVCLDCARKNIRIAADRATGPAGYIVNILGNLQVLDCGDGQYNWQQVADALQLVDSSAAYPVAEDVYFLGARPPVLASINN